MSTEIKEAVKPLNQMFKDDPNYRMRWQSNIAIAFVDNVRWHREKRGSRCLSNKSIHEIANAAADQFLKSIEYPDGYPLETLERNAELEGR